MLTHTRLMPRSDSSLNFRACTVIRMFASKAAGPCFRDCARNLLLSVPPHPSINTSAHACNLTARTVQLSPTAPTPFLTPKAFLQYRHAVCTCAAAAKNQNHDARLIAELKTTSFTPTSCTEDAQDNSDSQRCANKQIRAGRSGNHATNVSPQGISLPMLGMRPC